jgi:hypothetical protein
MKPKTKNGAFFVTCGCRNYIEQGCVVRAHGRAVLNNYNRTTGDPRVVVESRPGFIWAGSGTTDSGNANVLTINGFKVVGNVGRAAMFGWRIIGGLQASDPAMADLQCEIIDSNSRQARAPVGHATNHVNCASPRIPANWLSAPTNRCQAQAQHDAKRCGTQNRTGELNGNNLGHEITNLW